MTPDVNVLVAASRTDHPHHAVARAWLEDAVTASGAGAAFTLMPMVLASFLRLVTSPKIFQLATPIDDAVAFVDALLASPGVQLAPLGRGGRSCADSVSTSNWAAMTCRTLGCQLPWPTWASTSSALIETSGSCLLAASSRCSHPHSGGGLRGR